MSSSEDDWLTDSSDHELGHFSADQEGDESDVPDPENQDGNIQQARTLDDPWKKYKGENETKIRQVLFDKTLVGNIKSSMDNSNTLEPLKANNSFLNGRSHKDVYSSIRPVEAGFDILRRLADVEEALIGKILSYCNTATLYSLRLVSRLWWDLATTWFTDREAQLMNNWTEGVPSKEEFECQDLVSTVAVDDFGVVVGLENGKLCVFSRLTGQCELLWVAHGGLVTAIQVTNSVILSSGREGRGEVGRVQVWDRDTGRHLKSVRPPFKTDLKPEDAFCFLLVKHGFLFAMGVDKDVWIWALKEQEENGGTNLNIQFRLKGHYSTVLCCDLDKEGHIMTGSQDAQVRLWNLGPDLRDRSKAVACHNQHGNPVTAVQVLWPLGVSASSGSVRLYYHPTGACLRTFRFSAYVYDLHMDSRHFVTSHQDGSLNLWSLSACLADRMVVSKGSLHQGRLLVKPPLEDQDVWGNQFVARQGRFALERSCLVTMHEKKVVIHDYWAREGTRGEGEGGLLRDCDTPSSLPSLVSDVSEDEEWGEADPALHQGEAWGGLPGLP